MATAPVDVHLLDGAEPAELLRSTKGIWAKAHTMCPKFLGAIHNIWGFHLDFERMQDRLADPNFHAAAELHPGLGPCGRGVPAHRLEPEAHKAQIPDGARVQTRRDQSGNPGRRAWSRSASSSSAMVGPDGGRALGHRSESEAAETTDSKENEFGRASGGAVRTRPQVSAKALSGEDRFLRARWTADRSAMRQRLIGSEVELPLREPASDGRYRQEQT